MSARATLPLLLSACLCLALAGIVRAADPIDPRHPNFGGYFDGQSHTVNVNGRLEEADGLAVQAAINSTASGEVIIPGAGLVSRPIVIRGPRNIVLQGRGRGSLRAVHSGGLPSWATEPSLPGGFPLLLIRSRYKAPQPQWNQDTLLKSTPLVTGPGGHWGANGGLGWFVDFGDCWATGAAEGWPGAWPSLTVECFLRVDACPQGTGVVWAWRGETALGSHAVHQRVFLVPHADGGFVPWMEGRFGGVVVQQFAASGILRPGVLYWLAMVYDGTEVRLYIGEPGQIATAILRQQCPGTFAPHWSDRLTIGSTPGRWPSGSTVDPMFQGALDGFAIDDAPRYIPNTITAPAVKPTLDTRRMVCNFVDAGEGLVRCDTLFGESYVYIRQSGGGAGEIGVDVRDLTLSSYLGHGILADDAQQLRFSNVKVNGALTGMELWNQCYEASVRDFTANCTNFGLKGIGNCSVGVFDRLYLVAGHGVALVGMDAQAMNYTSLYSHSSRVCGWFGGDDFSGTFTHWTFGDEAFPFSERGAVFSNPASVSVRGLGAWFHGNPSAIEVIGGKVVHLTDCTFRGGGEPVKVSGTPARVILDACTDIDNAARPLTTYANAEIR